MRLYIKFWHLRWQSWPKMKRLWKKKKTDALELICAEIYRYNAAYNHNNRYLLYAWEISLIIFSLAVTFYILSQENYELISLFSFNMLSEYTIWYSGHHTPMYIISSQDLNYFFYKLAYLPMEYALVCYLSAVEDNILVWYQWVVCWGAWKLLDQGPALLYVFPDYSMCMFKINYTATFIVNAFREFYDYMLYREYTSYLDRHGWIIETIIFKDIRSAIDMHSFYLRMLLDRPLIIPKLPTLWETSLYSQFMVAFLNVLSYIFNLDSGIKIYTPEAVDSWGSNCEVTMSYLIAPVKWLSFKIWHSATYELIATTLNGWVTPPTPTQKRFWYAISVLVSLLSCFSASILNKLLDVSLTLIILYNLSLVVLMLLIKSSSIRNKFFYFYMYLALCSIWGFCYNFDGIILILILTELTLLIIFLLLAYNIKEPTSQLTTKVPYSLFVLLNIIFIFYYELLPSFNFKYVYYYENTPIIIASDFFIFYFYMFFSNIIIVYLIGLILGLFSIVFIYLYFTIRERVTKQIHLKKKIDFIRKQQLNRQPVKNTHIQFFQTK